MAIQHKGNAAGIKRRIREIPPPRPGHCHVCIGGCARRQPMRQRKFFGMGGLHHKADAAIGVQQQAPCSRRDAIQPIP